MEEARENNNDDEREERRNRKRQKMSKVWEHFRLNTNRKENKTHATERATERWEGLTVDFTPESSNITLLAAALDPRFRKLRFLPADEVFKVQSAVQAMALASKQQVRQPTAVNHGASSIAQDSPPAAHAKRAISFFDSDSTTSDEE
ncbi:hypothetical protein F2P81_002459 [Scophthalmus maximus]|uniref:Uncharacterized protein n=1 Tax=Scophthalmus maximus TaxID=52904 RepID=A0A6A4TQR2_SCOMX|nr:hypothetical protein F2P81_002459 [Scophthalmus maximus]